MNIERWAGYPTAVVYEAATGTKAVDHLLWGRKVHVIGAAKNGRLPISLWKALPEASDTPAAKKKKGAKKAAPYGWIRKADIQDKPILEVVFVDIGQGDGALVVMPDGKRILVDAGKDTNMRRFLEWRFGKFNREQRFEAAVISHSDEDHYGGFDDIFKTEGFKVDTVYHNGLVERKTASAGDSLGKRTTVGRNSFVTGLVNTDKEMKALLAKNALVDRKKYPTMLRDAVKQKKVKAFQSLAFEGAPRFLKGYGPKDPIRIEVLGPVVEPVGKGKGLRWFKDVGKTKNGHSVILKLTIGTVSMLLGGDLNTESQSLLLPMHTRLPYPPQDDQAREAMITRARAVFECDIAKACHHGSADFSEVFLAGLNPIATIVSSGDEESYAHPRPDAIGTYGLCGRGQRPMIFSTELARSSAEQFTLPDKFRKDLTTIIERYAKAVAKGDAAKQKEAKKALDKKLLDKHRAVSVFGAINVRTDGTKAVIAYMIESPRGKDKKWDVYRLEPGEDGRLRYAAN